MSDTKRGLDLFPGQGQDDRVPRARRTHILVFAIGAYQHWTRLRHPVAECQNLLAALTEGYEVEPKPRRILLDAEATCENIYNELSNLHDLLEEDNLIIIFSGHGYYSETRDEGFWVPVDARNLVFENGHVRNPIVFKRDLISIGDIVSTLKHVRAHHLLLIVDSCFAGSFTRLALPAPPTEGPSTNIPEEDLPSRSVLTSGLLEKVPDKSLFAEALVDLLRSENDEDWPVDWLAANIQQRIRRAANYDPKFESIIDAESRGGLFVIRRRRTLREGAGALDLDRLAEGSLNYLLRLEQGRFQVLKISDLILPDLQDAWLNTTVTQDGGGHPIPLPRALRNLGRRRTRHVLLLGGAGTGKSTSFVRLWRQWRQRRQGPIPLFVALNEYNTVAPEEREGFIVRYIAENYLNDTTTPLEAMRSWWLRPADPPQGQPRFLMLLDGLDELTADAEPLHRELQQLAERAGQVQIVLTARPDTGVQALPWTRDFHRIRLQPITEANVRAYLLDNGIGEVPENELFRKLLTNPFMLTLYPGTWQWTEIYGPATNDFFHFRPDIESTGELLNNFVEAQGAAYLQAFPEDESGLRWRLFLLRHLLPYLAWRMVAAGQFYFITRMVKADELPFTPILEEAYAWLDNERWFARHPSFRRHADDLGFGLAPEDRAAVHARSRAVLSDLTQDLHLMVLEGNSLRFLHQHFRDFFAALHIVRCFELAKDANRDLPPGQRQLPAVLRGAPLPAEVRQILGELLGEHYPERPPDDWIQMLAQDREG